ncbi:MAG: aldo/keto reductase [Burkholderiaceae bacterium]
MEKCSLGRSGISVAPLAFGGNVFGWTADQVMSFSLLDRFVDAGFDLIDTADVYSKWAPGHRGGESETIIGNWLQRSGKRDRVVIATKVGMEMGPDCKGLSAAYIQRAVEDSLRRLQTDRIDLYQSHADDPDTPLEETLGAYARLIEQGKVRASGASNYEAPRRVEALDVSRRLGLPAYCSAQPEYNLYDRAGYENALETICTANGHGVICYYSLASGFLTGKYRSEADLKKSVRGQGIAKYLDARGHRILAALDDAAGRCNATPAQVALAWLMTRPGIVAPIASATTIRQLDDLIAAARLRLDHESVQLLNRASAQA